MHVWPLKAYVPDSDGQGEDHQEHRGDCGGQVRAVGIPNAVTVVAAAPVVNVDVSAAGRGHGLARAVRDSVHNVKVDL
jgi:hypothetical protein